MLADQTILVRGNRLYVAGNFTDASGENVYCELPIATEADAATAVADFIQLHNQQLADAQLPHEPFVSLT